VTREDFAPGMSVKNKISGLQGTVLADPHDPTKLAAAHEDFLRVKAIGRNTFNTVWRITNIEIP
jgi:hypothetical protein